MIDLKEILKVRDLCKTYIVNQRQNNVLKNVNFTVYEGEMVAIMGPSGSGKSTQVLNLLAESPNAFEAVHVICPETTVNNEVYQTLKWYMV